MAKIRKVFFSEEKKQKTFANSGVCAAWKVRDSTRKSLWFLSSEKNAFLGLSASNQNNGAPV